MNIALKGSIFLFVLMAVFFIVSCSPSHRYKMLTFFFDGVPDPKSSSDLLSSDSLLKDTLLLANNSAILQASIQKMHAPYQDKQCNSCHDQTMMGKLNQVQPGLCYECHEDFSKKFEEVHGPVGGGFCTSCHSPHMSMNEHLLSRTGQSVCLHCHESSSLLDTDSHKDIKETLCTECHDPHGGNTQFFLKQ